HSNGKGEMAMAQGQGDPRGTSLRTGQLWHRLQRWLDQPRRPVRPRTLAATTPVHFEPLEPRLLLTANLILETNDLQSVSEGGQTVFYANASSVIHFTARLQGSSRSDIEIFQLDFATQSDLGAGNLQLSNWQVDARWSGQNFGFPVGTPSDTNISDGVVR